MQNRSRPGPTKADTTAYEMKCLLTHHVASCFKFYPSGIFTSKAPSNKPLHKRCSSVHFAAFTPLLLQPGKIRNFGITSAKRTSYLPCSRVSTYVCRRHGQQHSINFHRTCNVSKYFKDKSFVLKHSFL